MFRLLIGFVSHSTRSFGGCLTAICACFAALIVLQWAIAVVVGAVSAVPPAVIIALIGLAVLVAVLPPLWRGVAVITAVVGVVAFHAAPAAVVAVAIVLLAAWVGRRYGALIRPRARGARFANWMDLWLKGFLGHGRWPMGGRGWPLGGLRGGLTVRLPVARECEGVIVVAPPGSGKTSGPAVGAILSEADRPAGDLRSVVIGDLKDELAELTMASLARTHTVHVWNPGAPQECTLGFDPLSTLPDASDPRFPEEVAELAESWLQATRRSERNGQDGDFWLRLASSATRAALLAFLDGRPDGRFLDFADWIRALTVEQLVDCVERARSPYAARFAGELHTLLQTERTAASGWVDVQSRFDLLDGPHIRSAMSLTPIDWEVFVRAPTALYLKVAAQDAERLGPLLSLFLARMYRALIAIAARSPGNRLPREMRLIADEFGNLPRIAGIETQLATCRSYGIGHYLFVQSTSQIRHHYGRDLAQSITDNLVTKVCLGGAADEDARWFSARCGDRTAYHPTANYTAGTVFRGRGLSVGHAPEREPLVTPAEIMHMRNTVLVSTRGLPPVRCRLRPWYRDRRAVARLEADAREWSATHPAVGQPPSAAKVSPTASGSPSPNPLPWSMPNTPEPGGQDVPPLSRNHRDVPPPGCTEKEWVAAPWSIHEARFSMEDDLLALATQRIADLDALREGWQRSWPRCSPARYRRVTPVEAAEAPNVWQYVDEMARRLELR